MVDDVQALARAQAACLRSFQDPDCDVPSTVAIRVSDTEISCPLPLAALAASQVVELS